MDEECVNDKMVFENRKSEKMEILIYMHSHL